MMMGLPAWLSLMLVIALPVLIAGIFLVVRVVGARTVDSDHPAQP